MNEKASKKVTQKRQLTKGQAYTVIGIGCLMLLLSIVIPTEKDSTAHTVKVIMGLLGFGIAVVGGALRPMGAPKNTEK